MTESKDKSLPEKGRCNLHRKNENPTPVQNVHIISASPLSQTEQENLNGCEQKIASALGHFHCAFKIIGEQLLIIRDNRLYRTTHPTFERYCRDRWGIGRSHAYRQIDAFRTLQRLSPIGDTSSLREIDLRKIVPLTDHEQKRLLQVIQEKAVNRKITSAVIDIAVSEVRTPSANHSSQPEVPRLRAVEEALALVGTAVRELRQLPNVQEIMTLLKDAEKRLSLFLQLEVRN